MMMLIKLVTATPPVVSFVGYPALYLLVAGAGPASAKPTKNIKNNDLYSIYIFVYSLLLSTNQNSVQILNFIISIWDFLKRWDFWRVRYLKSEIFE